MVKRRTKKIFVISGSLAALALIGIGVFRAIHSPLFLVQVVEIADQQDGAPVDAQTIVELANVPVGKISLFDLSLKQIEQKVLTNSWIREVHLQKRFPQTLSISITFKEPRALLQKANGRLAYVDIDGRPFGRASLSLANDVPLLQNFDGETQERIAAALKLLTVWEKSALGKSSQVSSIIWDEERGFRVLATYPLKNSTQSSEKEQKGRSIVDVGQEIDASVDAQFVRLAKVFHYLSENSVSVRQIWADSGKKIVVKTAHGS